MTTDTRPFLLRAWHTILEMCGQDMSAARDAWYVAAHSDTLPYPVHQITWVVLDALEIEFEEQFGYPPQELVVDQVQLKDLCCWFDYGGTQAGIQRSFAKQFPGMQLVIGKADERFPAYLRGWRN